MNSLGFFYFIVLLVFVAARNSLFSSSSTSSSSLLVGFCVRVVSAWIAIAHKTRTYCSFTYSLFLEYLIWRRTKKNGIETNLRHFFDRNTTNNNNINSNNKLAQTMHRKWIERRFNLIKYTATTARPNVNKFFKSKVHFFNSNSIYTII